MRKTEVFGIDIPELGDPSDITVVSDAIHDVENAMGCKIEFMNAVSTPGLISLNSKVRIHPYTTYYDDMVFAFIAPIDIPVGNSIAIKIDDLPQQPFNNEAFNGKGSLVFITYNTKSGFKSYENGSKIINNLTTGGANDALSAEMGKQLQNNKLDKGAVSTEYDTAKKIEDKIKTKLNQGNVPAKYNTAEKIGNEIDGKVSKSGDTMTGKLKIQRNDYPEVIFSTDRPVGAVGYSVNEHRIYLENQTGEPRGLNIYDDGTVTLTASNLRTDQKEVITAINESFQKIIAEEIGSVRETIDILKLAEKLHTGFYRSSDGRNKWINLPQNMGSAFELTVTSISVYGVSDYKTLLLKDFNSNRYFTCCQKQWNLSAGPAQWTEWTEILTTDSKYFLGNSGIGAFHLIQNIGMKNKGSGYYDLVTGKLYVAKVDNYDTSVTINFEPADNVSLSNRDSVYIEQLWDYPGGLVAKQDITLSDNWENYDELQVIGTNESRMHMVQFTIPKNVIELSIAINSSFNLWTGAHTDYWAVFASHNNKTFRFHDKNTAILYTIYGIKKGR